MALTTVGDYQARMRELLHHIHLTYGGVNLDQWERNGGTLRADMDTLLADYKSYAQTKKNLSGGPGS